jgi:hypothetical protein
VLSISRCLSVGRELYHVCDSPPFVQHRLEKGDMQAAKKARTRGFKRSSRLNTDEQTSVVGAIIALHSHKYVFHQIVLFEDDIKAGISK